MTFENFRSTKENIVLVGKKQNKNDIHFRKGSSRIIGRIEFDK